MKKIFFLAALLLPMMSFAQERVMVIADPHVTPQSVIDMEPDFDNYMKTQRKMLDLSEPIWHAMLDTALKYKPDLVLIPGDLTRDGEAAAHDTVSAGILRLQTAGIRTLVIPGNHDLPGENWEALYPGTFDGAVKDPGSHSFAVEPLPGVTVIGIDGSDGKASIGKLSGATQAWILDQADAAVAKGNMIIAMSHWQILEHFDQVGQLEPASRFNNPDDLRDKLMHHGVNLVLTGHFHVSGITTFRDTTGLTSDSIVEITTGSPITFPCPYRWLTINKNRKGITVTTDYITSLGGITEFTDYSREWMREHTSNLIPSLARKLWGKLLDKWDEQIAPALQDAGLDPMAIMMLKMKLPQTDEAQVEITQKHIGAPAINMYLFYSEASEAKRPLEGNTVANALYDGMQAMLTELMGNSILGAVFFGIAKPFIEDPVQSLVEDKTLRTTAHADITDDLDVILGEPSEVPTGVESVEGDASRVVKYIRNGQLLIQKGNQIYTPQGQRIAQ
jgi:3',5'-cyclic AMP phosphodiesterase CpdA